MNFYSEQKAKSKKQKAKSKKQKTMLKLTALLGQGIFYE
ncbi:Hypothetical protein AJF4211_001830 [Avibacterium paragallinarum JF4211]|nr:Hypothetical protein AJF4211_001830 [Avibacterium paragallinarum JF4211]